MGSTYTRRSRRALAAAAMLGMVGGSLATMSTAHAAVMVSGSTIDSAGNYVEGSISVYTAAGAYVDNYYADSGAFDIPLEDGTYKLRFFPTSEYAPEWYRDKADQATADVVTVAGAAQTLAPWTIERSPSVTGIVRTADGRAVRNGLVQAYDAVSGTQLSSDSTDRSGAFRIGTTAASVKLQFRGNDPATGDLLATEWFNDKASVDTADAVVPTAAGADVGVVTLAPGGSIAGRITNEFGSPIHRAEACADGDCDYTDANGYYLIEGVNTGQQQVSFYDPIDEYVGEYYDNVPFGAGAVPTPVAVAPGQAVVNIDAALAAKPVVAPNGVDVSGTVRDELGALGIGYEVELYDTPADPRDAKVVGTTYSNRAGKYQFSQLDRIGGETEFKIVVRGDGPREDGDFAHRTIWSGDKLGYETAVAITAAPRVLDFTQPVAGGVSGAVTSEAGGVPEFPSVAFRDSANDYAGYAQDIGLDGTYDERSLWAGTYTVQFSADDHVSEWWKDALPEDATTITVKPGQVVTGISAALTKDVKAVDRPEVTGDAWVGKTIRLDEGRWNTEASSKFTYEWLVGTTVVATGPSLKVRKSHLGKKITGRVTNDAGFAQGQAITKATAKVGFQPKLKAKVSPRSISMVLKAKPLKAKKVNATVVVYEKVGTLANGEAKLKKLGKGKVKKGTGVVKLTKALGKGKHKLVFRIKGKGKVGSGDLMQKVKIKR
jgi:hypothetical protein